MKLIPCKVHAASILRDRWLLCDTELFILRLAPPQTANTQHCVAYLSSTENKQKLKFSKHWLLSVKAIL